MRDRERLDRALRGVDVVIHAAALKQVPAAEYNPFECIKTNVIGAENVVNACIDQRREAGDRAVDRQGGQPDQPLRRDQACSDKMFVAANHLAGGREHALRGGALRQRAWARAAAWCRSSSKPRQDGSMPITDPRMTRFWITLDEGAAFVGRCLDLMHGGEIFVPKIPSMRIVDLAEAMAPDCEQEIVGIRPGEKLHELLITRDDARLTLEFDDYFVVKPGIHMWNPKESQVYGGQQGRPVAPDFEYASNSNDRWITVERLRELVEEP